MVQMKVCKDHAEWLARRTQSIGGSDASCIVGMNPYKTNIELYNEKKGIIRTEDISDKPYVIYGTKAEEYLRKLFALDYPQYEVEYVENNMFTNSKYPYAHASLDGWLTDKETGKKGILEIKTTEILRSMQREKWKDRLPDNYYIQILHYLMVTEYDFVILKAQLKTTFEDDVYLQTKHYHINRADVEDDIQYLAEKELQFYECLKKGKEPNMVLPNF